MTCTNKQSRRQCADLNLRCFHKHDISGFGIIMVK